ncbi:MAG TPA: ATP-dependent Clp protease proteolytic subunit [Candidatus Paceibacterota bacterium]|nr:ATP-dependent Clp protease proteolytic subunit [Candidatus Paceibacterota bacterium]
MEIWYALTGEVDKREVQNALKFINEEIYSKPIKTLRFFIAAGNGDIASGINLYMYLKTLPIEVETIAFGEIDTAAAIVFLAGKTRGVVEGCRFLFREGRYTIQDQTAPIHVHEEAIAIFKRELHEVIFIIARETGNDTEVVANMLRRSKIMHVDEAKDFGLVHNVLATLPLYQQEKIGFRPA